MKTCLIGGAGFLGTHLTKALLDNDRDVVILDRIEGVGHKRVKSIIGDYGDKSLLKKALDGVDEIVLLAYASVPKTSFEDPSADMLNNLPPALAFFETASKLPLRKVVFVSSGGTVYGTNTAPVITENHPTNPISPYGITKLAIEKYAQMFHVSDNLPCVIVRPSNAYGEGQRPYSGQGLIATLIASFLNNKDVTLFGGKEIVRDYIHASDIASAIVATLDHGKPGQSYNIGTGVGTSNIEALTLIEKIAKKHKVTSPKIIFKAPRIFDAKSNVLNSSKLQRASGWTPKIDLENGLAETWRWLITQNFK